MIQIKRVYEPKNRKDGYRVLVDRLWPRGIKKQDLAMDEWLKELAPSSALRKSFGHNPSLWRSFVSAYKKELQAPESRELIKNLAKQAAKRTVTLLYSAQDQEHNQAVVLKDVIEKEVMKLRGK